MKANGGRGAAAYHRGDDGAYHAFAVVVLATRAARLTRISPFGDLSPFARFDLSPTIPPDG